MWTRRFLALQSLALVAGFVVAACGGGGETKSTTPPLGPTAGTPAATVAPAATVPPTPTATSAQVPTGQIRFAPARIAGYGLLPGIPFSKVHNDPMYDVLVGVDAKGEATAATGFATSWTSSADGLVWTFKTRGSVTFHDGTQATAKDFKHSLDFYMSKDSVSSNSGIRALFFDHIDVPDDATAVVTFKKSDLFLLLDNFTSAIGFGGYLLPKAYMDAKGYKEANKVAVGSGPFKYKSDIVNSELIMEAIDGRHWLYGVPRFKIASLSIVVDDNTRIALFKSGASDGGDVPRSAVREVQGSGFDIAKYEGYRYGWIRIHDQWQESISGYGKNPLSDLRVRQALTLAIDRDALVQTFLHGLGTPIFSALLPRDIGYKPSQAPLPKQDFAKAKSLLAEAGFPNGFNVTLYPFPSLTGLPVESPQIMEAVAVWWQTLGIKVDRKPIDVVTFLSIVAKHDFPAPTISGVWYGAIPVHNPGQPQGTSIKAGLYRVTEDREIETAALAVTAARTVPEYSAAVQKLDQLNLEKWIQINLFSSDDIFAVRKGFGGDKWQFGKVNEGINLAGLVTGQPNLVR